MPVIAVLAVATSGLAWWSPRIGQLVAAAVLLVALPVVTFAGGGH